MKILYIFGYKYTLQIWKNSGALEREFEFFNKMWNDHQVRYTLITYGNKNDLKIDLPDNIKIIPMFPNSTKDRCKYNNVYYVFYFSFQSL